MRPKRQLKPPVELRHIGELIHRETLQEELDEVVVRDAAEVHAEMMADDILFLLITRQNGDKVRMSVYFDRARMTGNYDGRKKGVRRTILVMAAEEESA